MPGFDGTGPQGLGPFTGRGMGFCVAELSQLPVQSASILPQTLPIYSKNFSLGRGFRGRRGRSFGRGRGMGRGRSRWFY